MQERYRVCPSAMKAMEDTISGFHCLCYDEVEAEKLTEFLNDDEIRKEGIIGSLVVCAALVRMFEKHTETPIVKAIKEAGDFKGDNDFNEELTIFQDKVKSGFHIIKK